MQNISALGAQKISTLDLGSVVQQQERCGNGMNVEAQRVGARALVARWCSEGSGAFQKHQTYTSYARRFPAPPPPNTTQNTYHDGSFEIQMSLLSSLITREQWSKEQPINFYRQIKKGLHLHRLTCILISHNATFHCLRDIWIVETIWCYWKAYLASSFKPCMTRSGRVMSRCLICESRALKFTLQMVQSPKKRGRWRMEFTDTHWK